MQTTLALLWRTQSFMQPSASPPNDRTLWILGARWRVGTPRRIQVTEGKRIDLSAQLEEFHGDAAQSELSFPPTLSNHERAVVHAECRKYGLTSQSQGSGPDRHIVVYKPVKPAEDTSDCAAFPLPLGAAAVAAIQNHFQRFPPSQVRASPLVLPVRTGTHARTHIEVCARLLPPHADSATACTRCRPSAL
jgi:hypothetical protein